MYSGVMVLGSSSTGSGLIWVRPSGLAGGISGSVRLGSSGSPIGGRRSKSGKPPRLKVDGRMPTASSRMRRLRLSLASRASWRTSARPIARRSSSGRRGGGSGVVVTVGATVPGLVCHSNSGGTSAAFCASSRVSVSSGRVPTGSSMWSAGRRTGLSCAFGSSAGPQARMTSAMAATLARTNSTTGQYRAHQPRVGWSGAVSSVCGSAGWPKSVCSSLGCIY